MRQQIVGLEEILRKDGKSACAIVLDPKLYKTCPRSSRPFQGWRYFPVNNAPEDLPNNSNVNSEISNSLAKELRSLGLI